MPVEFESPIIENIEAIASQAWESYDDTSHATQTDEQPEIFQSEKRLTYDPYLDLQKVQALYAERGTLSPETFAQKVETLKTEVWTNLGRALDERNNRISHAVTFDLVDGVLYPPDHSKPMATMIKDGIVYRKNMPGPIEDKEREQAELVEILKVQAWATDATTQAGDMLIKASPPTEVSGASYIDNYGDVYQITEDENGQRHVALARIKSGRSAEDYWALYQFNNGNLLRPDKLTPAFFIANPQKTAMSFEEVQHYLQDGAVGRSEQDCDWAKQVCEPIAIKATQQLFDDPKNTQKYLETIQAFFVANDLAVAQLDGRPSSIVSDVQELVKNLDDADMIMLSQQRLEQIYTACGIMEDFVQYYGDVKAEYLQGYYHPIQGVLDWILNPQDEGFGVDEYGTRKITCKECGCSYARPMGDRIPGCILTIKEGDKRVTEGQWDKEKKQQVFRKAGEVCGNTAGISC